MSSKSVETDEEVLGGSPYLEGTRIRVSDVGVKYDELGYTVEELLEAYPALDRDDVHEALAHYYRNREETAGKFSAGAEPA